MTADIYKQRISARFMQNTPDFERLCRSLLRELQRNEFVANQCRIARLRELTLLYAVASFARSVLLRLFLQAKKSTHGIPYGLPSVALAKDGGGKLNSSETISYAQVGCTDCKGTRTFDFFGKHL